MQDKEIHKLPFGWVDLFFLTGIAFVGLCQMKDPLFLFGILSAVFLFWKREKGYFRFSVPDQLLILLWLHEIINLFFSVEPLSVFFAAKMFTFSVIFYFLIRVCLNNKSKIIAFLSVICFLIFVLCLVALITFLLFRSTCAYIELGNLYDFRYLYKPLGYLSNVWGSLLIGFIGIVFFSLHYCSLNKTKFFFLTLLLALLFWNIIISFSRGVYIAFAFLFFSYLLFLVFSDISRRQKIWMIAVLVFPIVLAGTVHKQDVVRTLQFNQSLSQQRSISGRIDAMSFTFPLLKESLAIGTGAGTYSQVINEYRYEDDEIGFTNFAPNGYTQLLVEQGILGLILWGIFFVAIFVTVFKERKGSSISIIVGITLVSVLIREATFPALLGCTGFQMSIFIILAIFQNNILKKEKKENMGQRNGQYFSIIIFFITFSIGAYSVYFMIDDQNNRKALSATEVGNWETAEKFISKTTERTPYLINRSLIFIKLYEKTGDTLYLNRAENCLQKALLKNPRDKMIYYYRALVLRKKGNREASLSILTDLAQKFSNRSLYQLSVFDWLYEEEKTENALPYLLQAVKLSPSLLDSPYLNNILGKDSLINHSLKNGLLQYSSLKENLNDPIFLARSGKIFLSFGMEKEARQRLEESIRLLPNLIYPRYYLSKIEMNRNDPGKQIYLKQFVFLYSGLLSKDEIDKIVYAGEAEKSVTEKKDFADNSYPAKFQTWYHVSLMQIDSIFK
jgi:O-antigen ligase